MMKKLIDERGPFKKYNTGITYDWVSVSGIDIFRKSDNTKMRNSFPLKEIPELNIKDTIDNYYTIDMGGVKREDKEEYYREEPMTQEELQRLQEQEKLRDNE